jgi:DNA-binding LytR/AlgR family response regulator
MRVLIIEDEPLVAQRLERLTREVLGDELQQLRSAASVQAAAAQLEGQGETICLLDLNLHGEDGFALLREAMAEPWATIVVSGSTERALEAFELGIVDFVAKPFTATRLAVAFRRARERRETQGIRYLAVAFAGHVEMVALDQIVAVHGDDDFSSVELRTGERRLHKRTLAQLEALLPAGFLRVHRSHIVNMAAVQRLESGNRVLRLAGGSEVPVGRTYVAAVTARLI